jgi:hypothetical protein
MIFEKKPPFLAFVVLVPVYPCPHPSINRNLTVGDVINVITYEYDTYRQIYGYKMLDEPTKTHNIHARYIIPITSNTKCNCDMFVLMASGCQCGAINHDFL